MEYKIFIKECQSSRRKRSQPQYARQSKFTASYAKSHYELARDTSATINWIPSIHGLDTETNFNGYLGE